MALIDIPAEYRPFVNAVKKKCKDHKINLVLSPSKSVVLSETDEFGCSGFFDDGSRSLVVACGKPIEQWVPILVHESCHLDQFAEDPNWRSWTDAYCGLWGWLDGEVMLNNAQVQKLIETVIFVEWDCERRSIEKIKKLKLPINISDYCRKANSYLYSYKVMYQYKVFPSGIYNSTDVLKNAPSYLLKNPNNTNESHKIAINNFYDELVVQKKDKRGKAA